MDVIVISIGTLAKNSLWSERVPVRTSHATTTLIRSGKDLILVDPALPAPAVEARLFERTGLKLGAITQVFLTNWRPAHRRALPALTHAKWLMHGIEIQAAQRVLEDMQARNGPQEGDDSGNLTSEKDGEVAALLTAELSLLSRVEAAPDEIIEGLDLFPLPGYTEGQAGLLVTTPTMGTMIAGDAIPTAEHFAAGQVFGDCWDIKLAQQSLMEMYEIADAVIPGHDNIFMVPRASGM